jgi:hypothetical protein
MPDLVGVDHSTPEGGDDLYLTGVAVEVDNVERFREYYFQTVRGFCEEYGMEPAHPILKSKTIIDNLASFQIGDAVQDLAKNLLANPEISRVHVSIGWYDDQVDLEHNNETLHPVEFVSSYMKQFYPVMTLWKYHETNDYNFPDDALVDDVQGHAIKAWKYVANEFDLNLVPHGDMTYPSISTADILSYNLSKYLPEEEPFSEYEGIAGSWLIRNKNPQSDPYINNSTVNSKDSEYIVPSYRYTIQSELHYPHPILFLHDDLLSNKGEILPLTDLHSLARKWAFERGGAVLSLNQQRLPQILKGGDAIVYIREEASTLPQLFQDLHPSKEIQLMSGRDLVDAVDVDE